jgi:polysaccharide biosynthesis transport protein
MDTTLGQGDLREYLTVLRLRKWTVLVVLALVVAAAIAFSLTRTPIYTADARVQARPISLSSSDPDGTLNMETEKVLAKSINVARIAAEKLDFKGAPADLAENLDVSVDPNTEILVFLYSVTSARQAQRGAQAFAEGYIADRQQQAAETLRTASRPIEEDIAERTNELAEIEGELAGATSDSERARLQSQINILVSQIAILQQRLEDIATPEELNVGQVVIPAELPESPSSPNHVMNLLMALVVGTALGVSAAFLRERLDDRLRGRIDLEANAGVPVLAVIPAVRSWRHRDESMIVSLDLPDSPPAEAYRTLRTGVLFDAAATSTTKVVLVTSPEAGEGKTTTAANLGVSLAQAGKKVIIVAADLRRPRLQSFFDRNGDKGLTNVLVGETRLSDVLDRVPAVNNLSLVHCGPIPANPAELLGSQSMKSLMLELRSEADFVIIDAAPLLAVADSLTLAGYSDAVILVADAEKTQRTAVMHSRENLERVRARLIGAVLNNFDPSKARGYHSYTAYRGYGVGEDAVTEQRELRRRI